MLFMVCVLCFLSFYNICMMVSTASQNKKNQNTHKKNHTQYSIQLDSQTYFLLQDLKRSFSQITREYDDGRSLNESDVINILIQWFIESTQAHAHNPDDCRGCGGNCTC